MDPVSIVVAALAAGASTGLTDSVAAAIKDAYTGLKRLLNQRFPQIDVSAVERMPASEPKRRSLEEDLAAMGGVSSTDEDLLAAAERLIQAVKANAPEAAAVVGADFEDLQADVMRMRSVKSSGTGVRIRRGKFGTVDIGDIAAGETGGEHADP
jgi:hypothetical protein